MVINHNHNHLCNVNGPKDGHHVGLRQLDSGIGEGTGHVVYLCDPRVPMKRLDLR